MTWIYNQMFIDASWFEPILHQSNLANSYLGEMYLGRNAASFLNASRSVIGRTLLGIWSLIDNFWECSRQENLNPFRLHVPKKFTIHTYAWSFNEWNLQRRKYHDEDNLRWSCHLALALGAVCSRSRTRTTRPASSSVASSQFSTSGVLHKRNSFNCKYCWDLLHSCNFLIVHFYFYL